MEEGQRCVGLPCTEEPAGTEEQEGHVPSLCVVVHRTPSDCVDNDNNSFIIPSGSEPVTFLTREVLYQFSRGPMDKVSGPR